jgi:hypothetical protein
MRIFGPKGTEVAEGWGKLKNEDSISCTPPDIIKVIKSRSIGCAGHEARVGDKCKCARNIGILTKRTRICKINESYYKKYRRINDLSFSDYKILMRKTEGRETTWKTRVYSRVTLQCIL